MAARFLLGQVAVSTTPLTATANSATVQNFSSVGQVFQQFSNVDIQVQITAAPTGTSPTLTAQLYGSMDGVNFNAIGSATSSLNAAGITALANTNVDVPFLQVKFTLGGTTPSFAATVNVYGF